MEKRYFKYWGKAKKDHQQDGPDFHLLVYHCLDVAAVGYSLLDPKNKLCHRLAGSLGVDPNWLQHFYTFCLIFHDLGKFAQGFQNLAPNLSTDLVPYSTQCSYDVRHDSLGYGLWQRVIMKRITDIFQSTNNSKLTEWLETTFGHHGQPTDKSKARKALNSHFLNDDKIAAEEFVRDISTWWQPNLEPLESIDLKTFKSASWQLTGLSILADWLGSDQTIFTYQTEPQLSLIHI